MKQREKIILMVALVAVVYAVNALFFSDSPRVSSRSPEKQLEQAKTVASDISTILAKNDTSSTDTYIITRAAAKWAKAPFLASEEPIETRTSRTESVKEAPAAPFVYTGYIRAGHKALAVIDGMEYEIGEMLDSGGYIVRSISRTQVLIENSLDRTTTVLPMEETISIP